MANLPASYGHGSFSRLPATMSSKEDRAQLFIGNLPYRVRWQDLKDLFRKCGTVLRADVALTPENRSKGFGTVLYQNERDAAKAIEGFHGFNWQGRVLDVRLDQQDPTGSIALAMATAPPPNNGFQGASTWPGHFNGSPYGSPMMHPMQMPPHLSVPSGMSLGQSISRPGSAASNKPRTSSFAKSVNGDGATSDSPNPPRTDTQSPAERSEPQYQPPMAGPPQPNGNMYMPYGYPQPVHGGLMGFYHMPSRPPSVASPASYANRHLFVGNLPFNCQWQDLKDLFRAAGNILRADITLGPDGRSRGFGTVLFASEGDALRAVEMFNGFEYNGRLLKVHFDKFAPNGSQQGSPSMQSASLPNSLPTTPFPALPSRINSNEELSHGHHQETSHPLSHVSNAYERHALPEGLLRTPDATNKPRNHFSPGDSIVASAATQQSYTMHMMNMHGRHGPGPLQFQPAQMDFSTGPAALMSPQPGGPMNNAFDPMSPQTARVNMTPSMPGFSFHPFPQTPPLMPQFLSPGLGPFSPPAPPGSHRFNMAPGAPFHMQQMGSPDTPAFASMLANGYFPSVESYPSVSAVVEEGNREDPTDSSAILSTPPSEAKELEAKEQQTAPTSGQLGSDSYFPSLAQASQLGRRASTNSKPATSVGLGPSPDLSRDSTRSASTSATRADFTTPAGLDTSLANLNLKNPNAVTDGPDTDAPSSRRASASANTSAPSSGVPKAMFLEAQPNNASSMRRASFEAGSVQKTKKALDVGKSIWS